MTVGRGANTIINFPFPVQTDPSLPVLAPGDKERAAAKKADEDGTVTYVQQQIESSMALAKRLKVKPMELYFEIPV